MLLITLAIIIHTYSQHTNRVKSITFNNLIGVIIAFFITVFIGTRPLSGYFGDMGVYTRYFNHYTNGGSIDVDHDIAFHLFMKLSSKIMSVKMFFTLVAFIYVYPMYRISKNFFDENWFYAFFTFIISFSFWTYGVNGIRNGLATSLFLLGLAYFQNRFLMFCFFILSILIHKSVALPVFAFIISSLFNNSKYYFILWVLAIPLSLAFGDFWINLFSGLGFSEGRLNNYLTSQASETQFKSVGFRWDFVLYSAGAVFVGWYFIFKKTYQSLIYKTILNVYLICNAFWILVIRANFSNRFAYLSWFLMSLVIIYPFLKIRNSRQEFQPNLPKIIGLYFLFTFFMFVIYY